MGPTSSRQRRRYLVVAGSYPHLSIRSTETLLPEARISSRCDWNWSLLSLDPRRLAISHGADPYGIDIFDTDHFTFPLAPSSGSSQSSGHGRGGSSSGSSSGSGEAHFEGHRSCVTQLCWIQKQLGMVKGELDGLFTSVSADQTLRLWSYAGKELGLIQDSVPLTCVTCPAKYDLEAEAAAAAGESEGELSSQSSTSGSVSSAGTLFYGGNFRLGIPSILLGRPGTRNWTRTLDFEDERFQDVDLTVGSLGDLLQLATEGEKRREKERLRALRRQHKGVRSRYRHRHRGDHDTDSESEEGSLSEEESESESESESEEESESESEEESSEGEEFSEEEEEEGEEGVSVMIRYSSAAREVEEEAKKAKAASASSSTTAKKKKRVILVAPRLMNDAFYCGVREVDIERLEVVGRYIGHSGNVEALSMTDPGTTGAGRMLVSGGADNTVRLWDVEHKNRSEAAITLVQQSGKDSGLARTTSLLSVRDLVLCGMNRGEVAIWDIRKAQDPIVTFKPHFRGGSTYGMRQVERGEDAYVSVNQLGGGGNSSIAVWTSQGKIEMSVGDQEGHFGLALLDLPEKLVVDHSDDEIKERKKAERREARTVAQPSTVAAGSSLRTPTSLRRAVTFSYGPKGSPEGGATRSLRGAH